MPQSGWQLCGKCQGLFFGDNPTSVCPAGAAHIPTETPPTNYWLWYRDDPVGDQPNWRWCNKCQGLFFKGVPSGDWVAMGLDWFPSTGVCPAGGGHAHAGSPEYWLELYSSEIHYWDRTVYSSNGWAWCNKCQGLFKFQNTLTSGTCPAGGGHNLAADSAPYAFGVAEHR